jgi:GNAT superfamily N-acetyltransferase
VSQAPFPQQQPGRITVTYLEIADPARIEPPVHPRPPGLATREVRDPAVNRDMYRDVGADYHWTDRLVWGDRQWRAWSARVETHLIELDGATAGYFEIENEKSSAKIAIFGLLDQFHGRGLGGHALTLALDRAFEAGPRVWLTTCTLDGPNALPNYLKRGMEVFRQEERPWSG